jgi:hypothetical protein
MEKDLQQVRLEIATAMERAREALEALKKRLQPTGDAGDPNPPLPPKESASRFLDK